MTVSASTLNDLFQKKRVNLSLCPMCGTGDWHAQENLYAPPEIDESRRVSTTNFYPALAVMCGNCGYTHFFNALALGLLK